MEQQKINSRIQIPNQQKNANINDITNNYQQSQRSLHNISSSNIKSKSKLNSVGQFVISYNFQNDPNCQVRTHNMLIGLNDMIKEREGINKIRKNILQRVNSQTKNLVKYNNTEKDEQTCKMNLLRMKSNDNLMKYNESLLENDIKNKHNKESDNYLYQNKKISENQNAIKSFYIKKDQIVGGKKFSSSKVNLKSQYNTFYTDTKAGSPKNHKAFINKSIQKIGIRKQKKQRNQGNLNKQMRMYQNEVKDQFYEQKDNNNQIKSDTERNQKNKENKIPDKRQQRRYMLENLKEENKFNKSSDKQQRKRRENDENWLNLENDKNKNDQSQLNSINKISKDKMLNANNECFENHQNKSKVDITKQKVKNRQIINEKSNFGLKKTIQQQKINQQNHQRNLYSSNSTSLNNQSIHKIKRKYHPLLKNPVLNTTQYQKNPLFQQFHQIESQNEISSSQKPSNLQVQNQNFVNQKPDKSFQFSINQHLQRRSQDVNSNIQQQQNYKFQKSNKKFIQKTYKQAKIYNQGSIHQQLAKQNGYYLNENSQEHNNRPRNAESTKKFKQNYNQFLRLLSQQNQKKRQVQQYQNEKNLSLNMRTSRFKSLQAQNQHIKRILTPIGNSFLEDRRKKLSQQRKSKRKNTYENEKNVDGSIIESDQDILSINKKNDKKLKNANRYFSNTINNNMKINKSASQHVNSGNRKYQESSMLKKDLKNERSLYNSQKFKDNVNQLEGKDNQIKEKRKINAKINSFNQRQQKIKQDNKKSINQQQIPKKQNKNQQKNNKFNNKAKDNKKVFGQNKKQRLQGFTGIKIPQRAIQQSSSKYGRGINQNQNGTSQNKKNDNKEANKRKVQEKVGTIQINKNKNSIGKSPIKSTEGLKNAKNSNSNACINNSKNVSHNVSNGKSSSQMKAKHQSIDKRSAKQRERNYKDWKQRQRVQIQSKQQKQHIRRDKKYKQKDWKWANKERKERHEAQKKAGREVQQQMDSEDNTDLEPNQNSLQTHNSPQRQSKAKDQKKQHQNNEQKTNLALIQPLNQDNNSQMNDLENTQTLDVSRNKNIKEAQQQPTFSMQQKNLNLNQPTQTLLQSQKQSIQNHNPLTLSRQQKNTNSQNYLIPLQVPAQNKIFQQSPHETILSKLQNAPYQDSIIQDQPSLLQPLKFQQINKKKIEIIHNVMKNTNMKEQGIMQISESKFHIYNQESDKTLSQQNYPLDNTHLFHKIQQIQNRAKIVKYLYDLPNEHQLQIEKYIPNQKSGSLIINQNFKDLKIETIWQVIESKNLKQALKQITIYDKLYSDVRKRKQKNIGGNEEIGKGFLSKIFEPYENLNGQMGVWVHCVGVWRLITFKSQKQDLKRSSKESCLMMLQKAILQALKLHYSNISIQNVKEQQILKMLTGLRVSTLSKNYKNKDKIFKEVQYNIKKCHIVRAISSSNQSKFSSQTINCIRKIQNTPNGEKVIQIVSYSTKQSQISPKYFWIKEDKFLQFFNTFSIISKRKLNSHWTNMLIDIQNKNKAVYMIDSEQTYTSGSIILYPLKGQYRSNEKCTISFYKEVQPQVLKLVGKASQKLPQNQFVVHTSKLHFQFNIKGKYFVFLDLEDGKYNVSIESNYHGTKLQFIEHIKKQTMKNDQCEYVQIDKMFKKKQKPTNLQLQGSNLSQMIQLMKFMQKKIPQMDQNQKC